MWGVDKKMNLNLCARSPKRILTQFRAYNTVKNGICTQAWKHVSQLSPSLRGGGGGGGGVGTIRTTRGSHFLGILADRRNNLSSTDIQLVNPRGKNSIFLVGQVLLFSWDKKGSVCAEVDRKVLYLSAERLFCSWQRTSEFYSGLWTEKAWTCQQSEVLLYSHWTGRASTCLSAMHKVCSWQ